jgi:hypothetical protein
MPIARSVPDYAREADVADVKRRARAAWLAAKAAAANILPPTIADRLWVNGLQAIEVAPHAVQLVMLHRLESPFGS